MKKEKSEGKERAKCGRWYIRVYGELDHKPMVELESLEIIVKELHKLEQENKKLRDRIDELEKCNLNLQEWLDRKEELNKSYRKEIKEHQLYEKKLEQRIIEFEELLHGE